MRGLSHTGGDSRHRMKCYDHAIQKMIKLILIFLNYSSLYIMIK